MVKKKKNILDTTGMPPIAQANPPMLTPEQIKKATKVSVTPPKTETETTRTGGTKFYQDDRGFASGIERDGQTYLGKISPAEMQNIIALEQRKQIPAEFSAVEAGKQANISRAGEAATANLGLSQEQIMQAQQLGQEAPIDWGQAITAGLANVVPSTIGGAVGGAAVGAVGTGGALSIPLAIAGGIGGFVTGAFVGIRSDIKSQQSGEIASTQKVLTSARSNLRQIRMLAQADPSRADDAVELYNQQMALVYTAQAKLKLETQGNLNKFMEDGTERLVEFDLFLMPGGYADIQRMRMQEALMSGVPLSPEQIVMQLQQDMMEDEE